VLGDELADAVFTDRAGFGDAEAWKKAASGVMSGSRPEAEVVTKSMGTGWPGFSAASLSMAISMVSGAFRRSPKR